MSGFRFVLAALLFLLMACSPEPASETGSEAQQLVTSPDSALAMLLAGNGRFADAHLRHPHADTARVHRLAERGQHPYAAILGCADSRVPPEVIFDQGLGDLFTLRVAGNISDEAIVASIEYAVQELQVPLIVVMAHQHCGVMHAVCNKKLFGHLTQLANQMPPRAKQLLRNPHGLSPASLQAALEKTNAIETAKMLPNQSDILRQRVSRGKLRIVAGLYVLQTGRVMLLQDPAAN